MSQAPLTLEALRASQNALAADYRRFGVERRLLLTGHSHQAWPDVARDAVLLAWDDAALHVDDKWARAFERGDRVRAGFARLLGVAPDEVALGSSTHELLVRLLSALPLARRPRLVTTDGEFHTLRRQLDRLAEAGVAQVLKVRAEPVGTLAERLAAALDGTVAAVLVSSVLFQSARLVPDLGRLATACAHHGAELVVDAYHQLGAVPMDLAAEGLSGAFVVGGGYKYLQLGEGNCALRVPPSSTLLPVVTGWFSEFGALAERPAGAVPFGAGPARFAGSTYDPTSHYRGARVLEHFEERGLSPAFLRAVSQHQVGRLMSRFDALALDPSVLDRDRSAPLSSFGGFLALRSARAAELQAALAARGVLADHRGDTLRLGPAPYLSDAQLDLAMDALQDAARALPGARLAAPRDP